MSVRQNGAVIAGGGTKDMLTQKNITNCITEIPQDIKLELNAGTLTLKAGSKVYVPNGAGVFDEILITADKINSFSWMASGTKYLLTYLTDTNIIDGCDLSSCSSGTSFPVGPVNGWVCYRTDENKIYRYDGFNWQNIVGLPLGIATGSGSGVASIDQVFNGLGYIGGTVFGLPGLKALQPNGFNADGTSKNVEVELPSVKTWTTGNYSFQNAPLLVDNTGFYVSTGISYNKATNTNNANSAIIGYCSGTPYTISIFPHITAFRSLDYNDSEYIANCAMPSGRYINLTLGSSGTNYTAPADGYVTLIKEATNANQYIEMSTYQVFANMNSHFSGQLLYATIPVSKGGVFQVNYNAGGATNRFRFTYAVGAQ